MSLINKLGNPVTIRKFVNPENGGIHQWGYLSSANPIEIAWPGSRISRIGDEDELVFLHWINFDSCKPREKHMEKATECKIAHFLLENGKTKTKVRVPFLCKPLSVEKTDRGVWFHILIDSTKENDAEVEIYGVESIVPTSYQLAYNHYFMGTIDGISHFVGLPERPTEF